MRHTTESLVIEQPAGKWNQGFPADLSLPTELALEIFSNLLPTLRFAGKCSLQRSPKFLLRKQKEVRHAFDLSPYVFRLTAVLLCVALSGSRAQTSLQYQKPPQAIIDLVDTRPTPSVEVSPRDSAGSQWLLIESVSGLPSVADLAQPELRLAGLRFNPRTNGPSRGRYITSLMLQALPERRSQGDFRIVLPTPRSVSPSWSPDARHVSFVNASDNPALTPVSVCGSST